MKRIHDYSRQSERGKVEKLLIQVDEIKNDDNKNTKSKKQPVRSPAVMPTNNLDALFREGKEGTLRPPSIYSCRLSKRELTGSHKESQNVGALSSYRSNSADAMKLHYKNMVRNQPSKRKTNNVLKMLQDRRPKPKPRQK